MLPSLRGPLRTALMVVVLVVFLSSANLVSAHQDADEATADTSTTASIAVDDGSGTTIHFRGTINTDSDVDWIKVSLISGQMYRVALKGSTSSDDRTLEVPIIIGIYKGDDQRIDGTKDILSGRGKDARVHYYADTTAEYWISAGGVGTGTYDLRVLEVDDDTQPDNVSTPGTITVGGDQEGAKIDYRGDSDWFATTLTGGTRYKATVVPNLAIMWGQTKLYDSNGDRVSHDSRTANRHETFYTPDEDGTYYLAVSSWSASGGRYTLSIEEAPDVGGI